MVRRRHFSRVYSQASCAAALLALTGCLAPKYVKPSTPAPTEYKEGAGSPWRTANPSDHLARGKWWEIFGDPRLDQLEERVIVSNQNLKQAEAQYREAHAIVVTQRAAFFPTVNLAPQAIGDYGSATPSSSPRSNASFYALPLTATWTPDLFGQTRYSYENAAYSAQSSAALLENVRLTLQTQLASDYFALEELDMEGVILSSATDSYTQNLNLTLTRYKDGVASQVDVTLAQSQLDTTRAQLSDVSLSRAQMEHAVAVLVGETPSSFSLSTSTIAGLPPTVPIGLPSDLLERRPDVASAERLVAAANANVGLQRAAYFPTLSLSAEAGYSANLLTNLLTWPNRFWAIGATATETLLDFGRRRGLNEQAKAAYDEQVASYRQTVLTSFQQVEDELAGLSWLAQEAVDQDAAVKASQDSLRLELDQYKAGIVSYLNVITSEQIELTAERSASQVLGRRMEADVALILALGGGWDASQLPKN
jgi:NodT family efflux transporter outer membrane factor (OMF) lipoprotein